MPVIMSARRFLLPLVVVSFVIFSGCNSSIQSVNTGINLNQGVSPETLNLIYDGPEGFTLTYFPRTMIMAARASDCKIIEYDSTSERLTKKIRFDRKGNVINEENIFFQYWFAGTMRGNFQYTYDSSNRLVKMLGVNTEDSEDSIMIVYYYRDGLLYSEDKYEFAKKLKPGADPHLPGRDDFEKYATWNKLQTYRYSHSSDSITIETISSGKVTGKTTYLIGLDSLNCLQTVKEYRDTSLVEVANYFYAPGCIIRELKGKMNDGEEYRYSSKALIDEKKRQTEKISFEDNAVGNSRMIVAYNEDGTINSIKYNNITQVFKYTYY